MGFDFLNRKQIMFQNFFILLYIKGPKRTGKSCQTSLVAGICIFLELASFIIVMASFKNPLPKYLLTRKNLIIGAGRREILTLLVFLWYFVTKIILTYPEKNCSRDRTMIEITRTIYSNSERSEQFSVAECFFDFFLEVAHI